MDQRADALDRALVWCRENDVSDPDTAVAVAEKFYTFLTK